MWDPADHETTVLVIGWGWIIFEMGMILVLLLIYR